MGPLSYASEATTSYGVRPPICTYTDTKASIGTTVTAYEELIFL